MHTELNFPDVFIFLGQIKNQRKKKRSYFRPLTMYKFSAWYYNIAVHVNVHYLQNLIMSKLSKGSFCFMSKRRPISACTSEQLDEVLLCLSICYTAASMSVSGQRRPWSDCNNANVRAISVLRTLRIVVVCAGMKKEWFTVYKKSHFSH